jgi:SAM-dependent methyltransferase
VATTYGAIPSPNIWHHPAVYETENRAMDPARVIDTTLRELRPWTGATVLDIGCGTGFHLPRLADEALYVIGVEPNRALVAQAQRRTAALANVSVRQGSAQRIPVADASMDIAHARWAYFFGPGCQAGLRELSRVVRRGGVACVVDVDPTRSTFGRWFRAAYPNVDDAGNEKFFARHGWQTLRRDTCLRFESRSDFEAVMRIEFPPDVAERAIREHDGLEVDYAVVIRTREYT